MSIVKMSRLEVWAHSADAPELSRKLVKLRCVDVDTVPLDGQAVRACDVSETKREAERRLDRYTTAIGILTPYGSGKKRAALPDIARFTESGAAAEAEQVVGMVLSAVARMNEIDRELTALHERKAAVSPWRALDVPLREKQTESCCAVFGSFPASVTDAVLETETDDLPVSFRKVSAGAVSSYYFFLTTLSEEDALLRRLGRLGFTRAEFPEQTGLASAELSAVEKSAGALGRELEEIQTTLVKSGPYLDDIRVLWDMARTEITEAELRERMAATDDCVMLVGWLPEEKAPQAEKLLSRMEVAYQISEPEETDNVPVKLKNNRFASCFEWVVAMYSLPAYGSYDPTAVMSVFYVILFATMMADAGYGLLLILGGFLAPVIMKADEGFTRSMNMFGWCGVGCLVTGVLFGGYFGDLPLRIWASLAEDSSTVPASLAILADPVGQPTDFLIIGIILGFIHLVAGQVIDFVLSLKVNVFDAVCDHVFYWIIYAGIILIVVAPAPVGFIVAGVGAALVILTAGRKEKNILMRLPKGLLGLYGLVNFGSDIISYARILAIALSGSVLAQVFNILATMSDSPAFKFSVGIIILLVGHVLNCVLSALSGFVHTSRLQYVEFFGKFYKDGGKPYAPLLPSERFSKN